MKCEIVRDLLPLYIDKLTNEISNMEIEKHLNECKNCQNFYQEMTGALPDILPKAEIDDVTLIKKESKKRKKNKKLVITAISILCALLFCVILVLYPRSNIKYNDVILNYGVNENMAYVNLKLKHGGDLYFTGETKPLLDQKGDIVGSVSHLETNSGQGFLGTSNSGCEWISDLNEGTTLHIFKFSDKVVTIQDGELISIEDK